MRNFRIVIDIKNVPDYAESIVDAAIVAETVKDQLESGNEGGSGVTESGVEYSWELESL